MTHPIRQSIRLKHFDHSSNGCYFITLCSLKRECIFGEIKDGVFNPSPLGMIALDEWRKTEKIRQEVRLEAYCLMPNHFHALISIQNEASARATQRVAPTKSKTLKPKSIGSLLGQFKAVVSKRVGRPVWQRNYYEHIIRDDADLNTTRRYISENPLKWELDKNHPLNF